MAASYAPGPGVSAACEVVYRPLIVAAFPSGNVMSYAPGPGMPCSVRSLYLPAMEKPALRCSATSYAPGPGVSPDLVGLPLRPDIEN